MNTNNDKLKAEVTMEHLAKIRTALPMLTAALGLEQKRWLTRACPNRASSKTGTATGR